jgi:hypothetical protein
MQPVGLGLSRCAGVLDVGLEVGLGLALRRGRMLLCFLGPRGELGELVRYSHLNLLL